MEQRIIKFKAKCIADGEWAKGYYFKKPSYKKTSNGDIVEDGEVYCIYGMTKDDVHPYWYEVDPSTVCQFTGLKDSKGVDIYEGDLVDYESTGEVIYQRGAFYVKFSKYAECLLGNLLESKITEFRVKVIGSKFDRKEEK